MKCKKRYQFIINIKPFLQLGDNPVDEGHNIEFVLYSPQTIITPSIFHIDDTNILESTVVADTVFEYNSDFIQRRFYLMIFENNHLLQTTTFSMIVE